MSNILPLHDSNIFGTNVETLELAAQRNRDSIEDECAKKIQWMMTSVDLTDCTYEQKKHLNFKIQGIISDRDSALVENDHTLFLMFIELERAREKSLGKKKRSDIYYSNKIIKSLKRDLLQYLGQEELEKNKEKIYWAHKILSLVEQDENYISTLRSVFQGAGMDIRIEKTISPYEVVKQLQKAEHPAWKNRKPGTNPAEFIRENYGEKRSDGWHHCGLTRPDLKNNPGLYSAYSSWIELHPEGKLDFAFGGGKPRGRPRLPDTDENRRARDKEAKARQREEDRRGIMSLK